MYIFQFDSGVIDLRTDIPDGYENFPHITVDDDFKFLPNHTLSLDFENNKVTQIELSSAPVVEKSKTTEELIVDAINDI